MFNKKSNIDYENLNEVIKLSKKILKVVFTILILSIILIGLVIFDKLNVLSIIKNIISVITPFFIGIIIAWLFDPLVSFLQRKKIKRGLGSVIVIVLFAAILFLLFKTLIPLLIKQFNDFLKSVPGLMEEISNFVKQIFSKFSKFGLNFSDVESYIYKAFEVFTSNLTTTLPKNIINVSTSIISVVIKIVLGIMVGFYLLIDFDGVKRVFDFVPDKYYDNFIALMRKLNTTFRDFVQGTLFIALVVALISTLGYTLVGLPSPFLFGVLCGITNMIPYVGPWIGGALCVIVGFSVSPLVGILALVVAVLVQQIDNMFLQPLIMGKTMKLHPVTIMVGLLLFGYLFGVMGTIFATPIMAALKVIILHFNEKYGFLSRLKNDKNVERVSNEKSSNSD